MGATSARPAASTGPAQRPPGEADVGRAAHLAALGRVGLVQTVAGGIDEHLCAGVVALEARLAGERQLEVASPEMDGGARAWLVDPVEALRGVREGRPSRLQASFARLDGRERTEHEGLVRAIVALSQDRQGARVGGAASLDVPVSARSAP